MTALLWAKLSLYLGRQFGTRPPRPLSRPPRPLSHTPSPPSSHFPRFPLFQASPLSSASQGQEAGGDCATWEAMEMRQCLRSWVDFFLLLIFKFCAPWLIFFLFLRLRDYSMKI